jgi:CRP/FNR family transcriptional regulator, cyclic AMP receptor protein
MVVTPDLLRSFRILKSVPQTALEQLAQQSSLQKVARREIVLSAGKKEDHLCFLFEGRLQGVDFTIDGREVGLYFVEPGDYCGEIALFDKGTQPEFVIALTSAMVVMIPMDALREVMGSAPEIVNLLGMKLAARVRQMTYQRSLLGLPNIPQRVCCQLWALIPLAEKEQPNSRISNPPTHMEIAIMLNISRETVTRVFQVLQNRQIVRRDGSASLLVNDLESLKNFAEGKNEL